jgi:uncharacterized membrane protein YphA (DoxX/SURF4 family)
MSESQMASNASVLANEEGTRSMSSETMGRSHYWVRVIVRLFLAFIFLSYSVAKLVGTQFIDSGPTLEKPVGDLSGFELTWVYFGYSKLFGWFVAGGQLTAAFFLLFDRTARLGAAILLPIAVNIVVVNFAFNISDDTKVVSVVYLAMNLFLIAGDWRAWKRVLWDETADNPSRPRFVRWSALPVLKTLAFVVAGVAMWVLLDGLQQSITSTTPLTGDWQFQAIIVDGKPEPADPSKPQWRRLFFEGEYVFIATDRGLIAGQFKLTEGDQIEIGYDPAVLAPISPEERVEAHASGVMEAERNKPWPVTIQGKYQRDGTKLYIVGTRAGKAIELKLRTLVRPKF